MTRAVTLAQAASGTVLQVVQMSPVGATYFSTTSTSFVEVTASNITITPSSASSKIYVIFTWPGYAYSGSHMYHDIYRSVNGGAAVSCTGLSGGNDTMAITASGVGWGQQTMFYLDSPNTTLPVTYKHYVRVTSSSYAGLTGWAPSGVTINGVNTVAMEIAG